MSYPPYQSHSKREDDADIGYRPRYRTSSPTQGYPPSKDQVPVYQGYQASSAPNYPQAYSAPNYPRTSSYPQPYSGPNYLPTSSSPQAYSAPNYPQTSSYPQVYSAPSYVQTASYPLASSSAPNYAQISSYQQGYQPNQNLVVVGPHFCLPYETTFAITKHVISLSHGDWTIIDSSGKKAFKVDGKVLSVRDRKYLRDAAGNKILQIRKKIVTVHETWSMYAGNSDQLICNVKRTVPSRMDNQSIPSMDVFLAANAAEVMPDFQLTGNYLQRNLMLLCRGRTLAQMTPRFTFQNRIFGNDAFGITVAPGVDHAFVLALIVIMDSVYLQKHKSTTTTEE
ncbi:unnamed protein product [Sphagnum jensenii]|uniref:Uncharacterized protein n=1 Tax=Sphagnum jensenii TaxID=128206 RepID=A0ABP0WL95_9BRYO